MDGQTVCSSCGAVLLSAALSEREQARIAAAYPLSLRPQLRLIAVLREPVSRGLSWYNHKLHGWTERDSVRVGEDAKQEH